MAGDLARWYGASSRPSAERAHHLQRIGEALAVVEPTAPPVEPPADRVPGVMFRSRVWRAAALVVLLGTGAFALRGGRGGADVVTRPPSSTDELPVAPGGPAADAARAVDFALRLPDAAARQVTLAGDFNDWNAATLPMERDPSDGTWRVSVRLAPGRHTYSYVVDGTRWVIDPLAPRTVDGALGPTNVIAVPGAS
jgi:hypothetical protein